MQIKFLCVAILMVLLAACESQVTAKQDAKPAASELKSDNQVVSSVDANIQKNIQDAFNQAYPQLTIETIEPAPLANLYEVVLSPNKQLVYVDGKGEYFFIGELMDLKNQVNLTEKRMDQLNQVDYQSLPFESAIKEVRGNGKYQVAVFSDLDCPFCKRLEQEIAKMTDVTVYTFLMPIDSLHPQARAKSKQLWCQPDRTAAWTQWMREGKPIAAVAECPNPVDDLVTLSQKLGFNGTPTLVYPNGKVQAGFLPQEAFEQALRENQK